MKILLVTPYYYPRNYGGAPYVYKKLIELSKNTITIFTGYDDRYKSETMNFDSTVDYAIVRSRNLVFNNTSTNNLVNILGLVWHIITTSIRYILCIIKCSPDIIICGQVYEVGWLSMINKFFNLKTACYIHGEEITTIRPRGIWSRIREICAAKVINDASVVITVSNYTKNTIGQKYGIHDNVVVINNGVDLEEFFPKSKISIFENKYGILGRRILLSLARLVPKKGIDKVIEAMPEITANIPDAVYLVGGDGPDRVRLERLAEQVGVKDKVVYAGYLANDELNDFMNLGEIFIMPNREINGDTEGFGLVFLQASACGLPVVGGNAGGTDDAIQDGKSGFIINGNDKSQIVSQVIKLFKNDDLRKGMGDFGLNWVTKECSWQSRVKQFDEIIDGLFLKKDAV
jgi:phosphatidyl-myo-inositol dimannoside synthase